MLNPYFECDKGVLYCGNPLEIIPQVRFDLVITDPRIKKINEYFSNAKQGVINNAICVALYENMTTPNMYFWCNLSQLEPYISLFVNSARNCSFDILLERNKTNRGLTIDNLMSEYNCCLYLRKRGYCMPESYIDAKTVFQKPLRNSFSMVEALVRNSSKVNDTVLDCFASNGDTISACMNNNRKFIGIDTSERACERLVNKILNKDKRERLRFF